MSRQVLAAVPDMFFASKIRATAEHLGVEVRFFRDVELLLSAVRERRPDLIVVDLQSTAFNAVELARRVRDLSEPNTVPLVGFYSHVLTELQEEAQQAGYRVMPRSAFAARLAEVLNG